MSVESIIGTPCCKRCSFSHVEDGVTSCRRIPPTPHPVIGLAVDPKAPELGPQPYIAGKLAMFPQVEPDWCCGEFHQSSIIVPR